ncbi:hypothetical protein [Bacillus sp. NEB1478]|uniref:hypothetical protein n=1 Tax=Bacillus sp. NEB1478 TaxID=3073816 RepID=UPI0028732F59|nr:hypothetical protein [Bacillus sp. NEB1478]WNB91273.1 hypothetical protein RGB74_15395 [Bacillus sp. NEB1478]
MADFIRSLDMAIVGIFTLVFPIMSILAGMIGGLFKLKSWKTTLIVILFFLMIFIYYSWLIYSKHFLLNGPYIYLIYYGILAFGANQLVLTIKVRKKV